MSDVTASLSMATAALQNRATPSPVKTSDVTEARKTAEDFESYFISQFLHHITQHFIQVFAEELGKDVVGMDATAYEALSEYGFPGNVRELENLVERAVALSRESIIGYDLLPPSVTESRETADAVRIPEGGVSLEELVSDYERSLLREALSLSNGVKTKAARLLGVSFRSFRYRLEKLGIEDSKRED